MLPNLKCGGVVVNEFRVMGGRKRGSFTAGPTVRISFPPAKRWYGAGGGEMAPSSLHLTDGVP
jgi:hypothetical protein